MFLKTYIVYAQNYEETVMVANELNKNGALEALFKREKRKYTVGELEKQLFEPLRHADGYKHIFVTDFNFPRDHPDWPIAMQAKANFFEFTRVFSAMFTDGKQLLSLVIASSQIPSAVCYL